ncbi:MAG TPA: Mur ligase domain-containing protein [Candidatus Paceibacterota bacterium]|nr:Mur ligase domain-containing protein [Candidatus Paceibacterota bacterium]
MEVPKNIYMTGIGGIGMSALAQMLHAQGKTVAGSDREESPTTELLTSKGIHVDIDQAAGNIPEGTGLLIYSDAVPESNPERMRAKELGIEELSYFEALGEVSYGMKTIAVTGTHGKTTTTGMLTKILQTAGKEPTAIIGSIVRDFESNFLAGSDDLLIVEACEYRDHVLKLSPQILVITNIEWDHTDYFPTLDALVETFRTAAHKVPHDGYIVTNPAGSNIARVLAGAQAHIIDYTQEEVPTLSQIGEFNRENARAAAAAARSVFPDIQQGTIDRALLDFKGSWRRFEYKGETPLGALVYDDYAHHPTAIEKTLEAVRAKFPDKKIVVAFHAHLYSRTKSFLKEFARALAKADRSIIAPIYAAREPNDPSVSNQIIAEEIHAVGGLSLALDSFDEIRDELLKLDSSHLIITMGAGDIYKVADQIAD